MSARLLGVVAIIYIGVAISYALKRDPGMALAFVCYAGANVGFIISKGLTT